VLEGYPFLQISRSESLVPSGGKTHKDGLMPLTVKGEKTLTTMKNRYGAKKGKEIFYAGVNSGKLKGMESKTVSTRRKKRA